RELVFPIIVMTITLAAVYAPIGIQGGLTGTLFREFAFTLAGAVVVSGFIALTLSPMMASKLVRPSEEAPEFKKKVERIFGDIQNKYERTLKKVLEYKAAVITGTVVLTLLIFPLYMFSTKELAPKEDQ